MLCLNVCMLSPQAIQHPNDEHVQESAWAAVVPLVGKLKKFYEFSIKLGMLSLSLHSCAQHTTL